jgi:hypothetical protein
MQVRAASVQQMSKADLLEEARQKHLRQYLEVELEERMANLNSGTALQFARQHGMLDKHETTALFADRHLPMRGTKIDCKCGHVFHTDYPIEILPPIGECPKCGTGYCPEDGCDSDE